MGKRVRKKRKRRGGRRGRSGRSGGGGVLTGMRSGFRNAAHTVTGVRTPRGRARRRGVSLILTAVFVIAAAAIVLGRGM